MNDGKVEAGDTEERGWGRGSEERKDYKKFGKRNGKMISGR